MLTRMVKIAIFPLVWGVIALTAYSVVQAGQNALVESIKNDGSTKALSKPADKPDKMFPDGFTHDFGKVARTRLEHAFRIVNTSQVPLQIISLRAY